MREQVASARQVQADRFHGSRTRYNADMTHRQTRQFCPIDDECQNLLQAAMTEMGLSARAHDKILRVARTIADLDGSDAIRPPTSTRRSTTGCWIGSCGRKSELRLRQSPADTASFLRAAGATIMGKQ